MSYPDMLPLLFPTVSEYAESDAPGVEPPSDYFSDSEYAESDAPDKGLFEMPNHCDQDPFERAFLSAEEQDLSHDCTEYLQRLDWVENFYIAEANEECKTCHLEIVCKFGNVPRIADIMQHFGEDVLPFVTYKAEKGTKLDCFINQDGILKDEFDTALRSIDWVESYSTGVVITCKHDNVPSMGDLSRKISKDTLPYVEFTNSKQLESQEQIVEQDGKGDEEQIPISSDHESDKESESDDEEYTESGSEDESSPSWFERTILNSNYEVRKKYKEALRSLGWVKACAVGVPNEEHDELHLLLFCKKGEVPRMAQLKKCFGAEIISNVEFMAEITDLKFAMDHRRHSEPSDGKSPFGESSRDELISTSKCQAMCVKSGDGIYQEHEDPGCYGTVGFCVRTNNNPDKLLLATCYHVCYCGNKLPKDKGKAHQILTDDSENENSPTRTASFWSITKRERKEEQSQKGVEERNEGNVPEQKRGTEESEEGKPDDQDCNNSTKEIKLGPFSWGKYDERCDICFVEGPDVKCKCSTPDANHKRPILRRRDIMKKIKQSKKSPCVVEKSGHRTGTKNGHLHGFDYCHLGEEITTKGVLLVKDVDCEQSFSLPGDSGSLVSLVTRENEKIPIAYIKLSATMKENGGGESIVHVCHCLIDLVRTCRDDEKNNVCNRRSCRKETKGIPLGKASENTLLDVKVKDSIAINIKNVLSEELQPVYDKVYKMSNKFVDVQNGVPTSLTVMELDVTGLMTELVGKVQEVVNRVSPDLNENMTKLATSHFYNKLCCN